MSLNDLRIRNPSSFVMFIFGISAFLLGVIGIIRPEFTLQILNFDTITRTSRVQADFTIVFLTTSSMASLNVGAYYILASLVNFKPFYWWTVPFRIFTFIIFTSLVLRDLAPTGFLLVGIWEALGALATAIALIYELRTDTS